MAKTNEVVGKNNQKATTDKKAFKPLSWKQVLSAAIAAILVIVMWIFGSPLYQSNGMVIDPAKPQNPAITLAALTMLGLFISVLYGIWRFAVVSFIMGRNVFKFKEYNLFGKFLMPIISIAMLIFALLALIGSLGLTASLSMGLLNNPEGKDWDQAGRLLQTWLQMANAESGTGAFFIIYGIANIGFTLLGIAYIVLAWISKKRKKDQDQNQDQPVVNQNQA